MLLLLASAPGQVFSKDQLYDAAWHEEYRYGTTAVENIIWRLRQKLEDDPKHAAAAEVRGRSQAPGLHQDGHPKRI